MLIVVLRRARASRSTRVSGVCLVFGRLIRRPGFRVELRVREKHAAGLGVADQDAALLVRAHDSGLTNAGDEELPFVVVIEEFDEFDAEGQWRYASVGGFAFGVGANGDLAADVNGVMQHADVKTDLG